MKKYFFLFLFFSSLTSAQTSSLGWIKNNQKYLKIEINKTGAYELKIDDIGKLLPEIYMANINQVELYHNGKSVSFDASIKNGLIRNGDKIFFYGEKNDGKNEGEMYRPSIAQPNTLYSLFSDKSTYYLTINPSSDSRKSIEFENSNFDSKFTLNQNYQQYRNIQVFTSDFTFNSVTGPIPYLQHSYFELGEGFTGPLKKEKIKYEVPVYVQDISIPEVELELQLNGRDNNVKKINIVFEKTDTTIIINEFSPKTIKFKQTLSKIDNPILYMTCIGGSYSISYLKTSYVKKNTLRGKNGYIYIDSPNAENLHVENVENADFRIWNVTDPANISEATRLNFQTYSVVPKTPSSVYYYFSAYESPMKISVFEPNVTTFNKDANFLIISSKVLYSSSLAYADFRSSVEGGGYKVELVLVEDLYDQFNFGVKSPIAIKNYLRYKLLQGKPEYLLLLGKAYSSYTGRDSPLDLVPSFGYPASDVLLSSGIVTDIDVPGLATGRIPASNNEEVLLYLKKLKQKINLPNEIQQKNIIHLSGGESFSQIETWASYMANLAAISNKSEFGVNILSKKKQILDPKEPANIAENLNDGTSLVSFFGHSSYQLVDLNIDFVSNPLIGYDNKRYPILYFNGCAFNNYFREIPTLSQNWLFTADKGAIATIGQSYYGYPSSLIKHAEIFYDVLFNSNVEPTIGEAMKLTAQRVAELPNKTELDILNNDQTLIFGDPALKIFGYKKPDFKINEAKFVDKDSTKLFLSISNLGKYKKNEKLELQIIKKNSFERDTVTVILPFTKYQDSLTVSVSTSTFLSEIELRLDPNNKIEEENEENNLLIIRFGEPLVVGDDIKPSLLVLFENQNPFEKMSISINPTLLINIIDDKNLPNSGHPSEYLKIYMKSCDTCNFITVPIENYEFSFISITEKNLQLLLNFKNLKPSIYEMAIIGNDKAGNSTKENPYLLNFEVMVITGTTKERNTQSIKVYPNPAINCVNFERNMDKNSSYQYFIFASDGKLVAQWKTSGSPNNKVSSWCDGKPGRYYYNLLEMDQDGKNRIYSGKIHIIE